MSSHEQAGAHGHGHEKKHKKESWWVTFIGEEEFAAFLKVAFIVTGVIVFFFLVNLIAYNISK